MARPVEHERGDVERLATEALCDRADVLGNRLIEIDDAPPTTVQYLVDINTASWPEIAQLPDVGETLARRIVEHRRQNGPFFDHEELRRVGEGIGLTTVYRTLQALADAGEVDVLRTDSGEAVYRRCASDDHHHHLVCRQCGTAVEIAGPAVETWAQRVAAEHGFTDLSHTVEMFGLCRDCTASRQR